MIRCDDGVTYIQLLDYLPAMQSQLRKTLFLVFVCDAVLGTEVIA
jgi:hypothetical protein